MIELFVFKDEWRLYKNDFTKKMSRNCHGENLSSYQFSDFPFPFFISHISLKEEPRSVEYNENYFFYNNIWFNVQVN